MPKKHCSAMSNSAWCDLNSKRDVLKLHDKCLKPKCNCQNVITFAPHQYRLEGGSIKSKLQKIFRGTQIAGKKLLKPATTASAPSFGMSVSSKTKNPKVGQATTILLKSISGWKNLNRTDMHGHGLRLKVRYFYLK